MHTDCSCNCNTQSIRLVRQGSWVLQADPEVFATAGSDRSVALYDLRHSTPVRKIVMQTKTNAMSWNPMEPLNFVVANEDCNLYSYDMRKLDTAFCVHEVRPPLVLLAVLEAW